MKHFKYLLRFFVRANNSKKHVDCECFATISSEHVPVKGDLVFIADCDIHPMQHLKDVEPGNIYKILYSVIVYDSECTTRKDTTIEVVVKKVNI